MVEYQTGASGDREGSAAIRMPL